MGIENLFLRFHGFSRQELGSQGASKDQKWLYDQAKESILIVANGAPTIEVLEKAIGKRCRIEIVVGPGQTWDNILPLKTRGISVYELEELPSRNFDLIDRKKVRVEVPEGHKVNQYVVLDSFIHASELAREFYSLRSKAKPM